MAENRTCSRDGCPRPVTSNRTGNHCCGMCKTLDRELTRLQGLYQTAGDPTPDTSAWVLLVELADGWTQFQSARGALVREILYTNRRK